jgi:hypothetical protein
MRKDDPEIKCRAVPIRLWDDVPIDPGTQHRTFEEIYWQIYELLFAAYENRDDRWQAVKIIIQAEKLIAQYTDAGFDLLIPLQEVLHQLFRAERRIFIRRALLCREQDRPIYKAALKKWDCDADAAADFRVVERHLSEGRALFADLRRWG